MAEPIRADDSLHTICPGCEGWGHIREGKDSTTPCAVCNGEGTVEMRVDDAPPVLLGILLAVVVVVVGWIVFVATDALRGAQ